MPRILPFFFMLAVFQCSAISVTKSHTYGAALTIDGTADYGVALTSLNFISGVDFPVGDRVSSVTVSIEFHKTDGSCSSPASGYAYHGETTFRLDGPSGKNVILANDDTWTGGADVSTVTVTFSDVAGSIPSGSPTTGTFQPKGGNLSDFTNDFAAGSWTLRAGDDAGANPLCIYSYSITINTFTPLPIELLSFSAKLVQGRVNINWVTSTELNNDYFTLERSSDGEVWDDLFFINGSGVSLEEISYSIIDYSPLNSRSYYRLKQTDFDGVSTNSKIETILNTANSINVFGSGDQIRLENLMNENLIIVYNSFSQIVYSNSVNEKSLVIDGLSSGMYFVKINNNEVKKVVLSF